jgi:hypothetical protein
MVNLDVPGNPLPTIGPVMIIKGLSGASGSRFMGYLSRKSFAARQLPPIYFCNVASSMMKSEQVEFVKLTCKNLPAYPFIITSHVVFL